MPKLTKTLVDGATPAAADTWIWDSEVPGFGMRMQPSGRKTYVIRYRNAARVQRKQTIARCCDMPPEQARQLARKKFAEIAAGADPAQARQDVLSAPIMTDLMDRYMREHARPFKKASSADIDERLWRKHVLPFFGASRRVADVRREEVLALAGSMAATPATANQCIALLSKAFNLADVWGWRKDGNPCRQVRKFKLREREAILSPAKIADLDRALVELVAEGQIPKAMSDLVRLLMLTGCRLREIMQARQEWVDRERRLLLLPTSKVGQRRIALSDAAMTVIEGIEPGPWLIPGRSHAEPMKSPYKAWRKICARAKLPPECRHHDLRHTAGSLGHMAGLTQKQIATMLGHSQLSTTERYLHGFASDHAKAAEVIGKVIADSLVPA